jgi:hypothetical protein
LRFCVAQWFSNIWRIIDVYGVCVCGLLSGDPFQSIIQRKHTATMRVKDYRLTPVASFRGM